MRGDVKKGNASKAEEILGTCGNICIVWKALNFRN